MADDWQDKTEEATPKKLQEARKKGNVSQSQDFSMGLMLFFGTGLFFFLGSYMFDRLAGFIKGIYSHLREPFADVPSLIFWLKQGLLELAMLLLPFALTLLLLGVLSNLVQIGPLFAPERLKPKWEKTNIFDVRNYKKFMDARALMKTTFGVMKLFVIAVVLSLFIYFYAPRMTRYMHGNPQEISSFLASLILMMSFVVACIFIFLGILDLVFQKRKHRTDLKMTKQEVKDESKQSEGDPLVKSKLRSTMIAFMQSRMKTNVPQADVVVTNPIHYAIAIKYDAETMPAPICVAKGARKLAFAIREIAKEHKIPIVENPPLAQGLYKGVDVGMMVPPDFYHAVAEVLAYVYRLDQAKKEQELEGARK